MADPIRNLLDELNAALDASGEQSAEVQKILKQEEIEQKKFLIMNKKLHRKTLNKQIYKMI